MATIVVMTVFAITVVALLNLDRLSRLIARTHTSASAATDSSPQNSAGLAAHLVSDCRARRPTDGSAKHCAAIHGIGIHAGGKKQGDN
ncbi:MAG TPA: hypothetical protein VFW53_10880 [Gallionella sp.]|nr:hypothetical protein [Gallionella sp.]